MANEVKLQAKGDDELRVQVLKVVRDGGFGAGISDLEREVWDRMPERFRLLYELLWLRAFGRSVGGAPGSADQNVVVGTRRVVRVSTGQTETRGGAHSGKKLAGASHKDTVTNESALNMLRRIDRRLRQIARDMDGYLHQTATPGGMRRCSVCKKFGDVEWVYCPRDGKPMEEVD